MDKQADKTTINFSNNKVFKVFETFSGIGSQHKALKYLKEKYGLNYEVVATSEWDIYAIISYDCIHNSPIDRDNLKKVAKNLGLKNDNDVETYLSKFDFSKNGKEKMKSLDKLDMDIKYRLAIANKRTKNLGSITSLENENLPECDMLTYSFPCQDLSIANMGRASGMSKDGGTRSGLLWEVEKILKNYKRNNMLPKYLMLENVGNMISPKFKPDYDKWIKCLDDFGYKTHTISKGLTAKDFGIPQSRKRIFAISFLDGKGISIFEKLIQKKKKTASNEELAYALNKKFLRLNINDKEAQECIINKTKSRLMMIRENIQYSKDNKKICPTITTKQDRHPNCGSIQIGNDHRFLTPRELFLLMGFKNRDVDAIYKDSIKLPLAIRYKQAGNSIVVNVLVAIFQCIQEINNETKIN